MSERERESKDERVRKGDRERESKNEKAFFSGAFDKIERTNKGGRLEDVQWEECPASRGCRARRDWPFPGLETSSSAKKSRAQMTIIFCRVKVFS